MSGYNYSFTIEKGPSLNGWLQLELRVNSLRLKKRNGYKCLCEGNIVPLRKLDHCKWPSEIMMEPLKCMAASAPLK